MNPLEVSLIMGFFGLIMFLVGLYFGYDLGVEKGWRMSEHVRAEFEKVFKDKL